MMKMKMIKIGFFLGALLLFAGAAHAWQFEIDNVENDMTFEVWFNTQSDTVLLDSYGLDFVYDVGEMNWDAAVFTNNAPSPLISNMMGDMYENSSGSLWNFNAATFGAGPTLGPETRIQLGSITFDLYDPDSSVEDGNQDLEFDLSSQNLIVTLNVNDAGMTEYKAMDGTFQYAYGEALDVGDPVPVPGALWLLGSGIVGIVGLRRKRAA
jgi:hypothetical protein